MVQSPEQVMHRYAKAYENLYNRRPRDLRAVDDKWVIVNGARMRVGELEHLTRQLQTEYNQTVSEKKNVLGRLIKWFKG